MIKNLRQNFEINKIEVNDKFNINFNSYFEDVLNSLKEFKTDIFKAND